PCGGRTCTAAADDRCSRLACKVFAAAVKGAVEEGTNLSAGVGVVDRGAKDKAVGLLCLLDKFVDPVIKDAFSQLCAGTAGDAAGNRLFTDLDNFGFNPIFFERSRHLAQGSIGAALCVWAAVEQKYLHGNSFFLKNAKNFASL